MKRLLILIFFSGLIVMPLFAQGHGHGGGYHHGMWPDSLETITISGNVIIDSTHFMPMYYLDTNKNDGDVVTITGGLHEEMMMDIPSLMVYKINGVEWRNHDGPPHWSGNWLFRNDSDTGFVFCPTDSLDWMAHPSGSMMGMMSGGGLFPDSVYCQFEELYPDHLPGQHDSTLFAGYYMNMYDPAGQTMMSMGGTMGSMGGMRFNRPTNFHFHYNNEHLNQLKLSDEEIYVKFWDKNNSVWAPLNNYQIDAENNIIRFQSFDMYNYYALFGAKIRTNVLKDKTGIPDNFMLYQNYPNPFNPETTIKFDLPNQSSVTLTIYNVLGQKIKPLLSKTLESGSYQILWDGTNLHSTNVPSGIYFVQIKVQNRTKIIKMTMIK